MKCWLINDDDWVSINVNRDLSELGLNAICDYIHGYILFSCVATFLNVKTERRIAK